MNIFFLDRDPQVAAQYHCDRHVCKMIVESAQLLSTAHRVLDGNECGRLPDERNAILYRATHKNHPSAIWVRSNIEHYRWTFNLLYYLIWEYKNRWGFHKEHKTQRLQFPLLNAPRAIPTGPWQDPPQCMPDDVKNHYAILAYRQYYAKYKSHFAKWARGPEPEWWNEAIQRVYTGE